MIKPVKFRMKFRKPGNNKYSVGVPKEIAEQIKSEYLYIYVDKGKIVLEPEILEAHQGRTVQSTPPDVPASDRPIKESASSDLLPSKV